MKRFILSPEAKQDLLAIKTYLVKEASIDVTQYVLRELREGMAFLGRMPGAGHVREDLTDMPVKFWPVFSYLIVYDPVKRPIEIVQILHGRRDVATVLGDDDE